MVSTPTKASSRKTMNNNNIENKNNTRVDKGKRTGAVIVASQVLKDGMEDVEAVFALAKSPEPISPEPEKETDDDDDDDDAPTATIVKRTRFSLPGVAAAAGDDDSSSVRTAARVEPKGIMKKYMRMTARNSMSPSELSRVSTALPLATTATDTEQQANQDDETEDEDAVEEDVEQVRKSREIPNENVRVLQQQQRTTSPDMEPVDNDDEFPAADDNYDDDDDDLAPPAPPDSPEADDMDQDQAALAESPNNKVGFPSELDDDDDDDDKEGDGFEMMETDADPETPASVREERRKKAEKLVKKAKSKNKKRKSHKLDESMDTTEEETVKTAPRKSKKRKKKQSRNPFTPKGMQSGPREFDSVPVSDLKDSPKPGDEKLRRSKRSQIAPLQYWKNERMEYGPYDDAPSDSLGNMPVPKRVSKALPTPYKKREFTARAAAPAGKGKKGSKASAAAAEAAVEDEVFDSTKLRKRRSVIDSDAAVLWDDVTGGSVEQRVVAYYQDAEPRDLPCAPTRKKSEGTVVGNAASAFHVSNEESDDYVGFIMGNLTLPPKGVKDSESVGYCAQTFTVVTGQAGSVEIAFGDPAEDMNGALNPKTAHRFLLGPKDLFRIPPGNCYRLENHSKHSECFLTWTIIRPTRPIA